MSDDSSHNSDNEKNGRGPDRSGIRPSPSRSQRLDVLFDVLTNQRRRHVLYYLQQQGGVADTGALATQLAAWETGCAVDDVDDERRERTFADLYHTHLPKLEGAGVIDYDERTGTIRLWEHADLLQNVLRVATWIERPDPG